MKNAFVIVDGYSSGRLFIGAFRKKLMGDANSVVVHVQSTPAFYTAMAAPEIEKYDENIVFRGDIQEVVAALAKYRVLAVFPGQEPGVELADLLSESLGLKNSNGTKLSSARRNKFDMIDAVASAGLAVPKYLKTNNYQTILQWIKDNTHYPVVVKALRSAGTDGVFVCKNEAALKSAFERLVGTTTIYNEVNDEVLIESFLDGREYVVNTVSLAGRHYVTEVGVYRKRLVEGYGTIYDTLTLLPSTSREAQIVMEYNYKVLKALEIANGPSHSEIMLTSEGPKLVEVGARISGVAHATFYNECLGLSQVDLAVEAYVEPNKFLQICTAGAYKLRQYGVVVDLIYDGVPGTIERIDENILAQIKALASVKEFVLRVKPGAKIGPTTTLINAPARIFMAHESGEVVQKEYEEIQALKNKLIRVTPSLTERPDAFASLASSVQKEEKQELSLAHR